MLKSSVKQLFIIFFICVALQGLALADDVVITGPGKQDIVVDENSFEFKVDFSKADEEGLKKLPLLDGIVLSIGGCKIRFWAKDEPCPRRYGHNGHLYGGNHMGVDIDNDNPGQNYFHDTALSATVTKDDAADRNGKPLNSKVAARAQSMLNNGNMWCNIDRQASEYPGKALVRVEVYGNVTAVVDPRLVTTFYNAFVQTTTPAPTTTTRKPTTTMTSTTTTAPTTTTQKPSTLSTTQASSSTLRTSTPTSTPTIISTAVKSPCPECEERGLEPWLIALIVAIIVLALSAIVLCIVLFCCYRRMQKVKAQKVAKSEHLTVVSTMSTVSTAPGPLVKQTNLYGPDMMYFGRDATPVDPNAKSQVTNPVPQASPAPATSPMQTPQ